MEYASTGIWNSSQSSGQHQHMPRSSRSDETAEQSKLNFEQAMLDFQTMFPNAKRDYIEQVLRANEGNVEKTIDQLLTNPGSNLTVDLRETTTSPQIRKVRKPSKWNPAVVGELPYDFLRITAPQQIVIPTIEEQEHSRKQAAKTDPFKLRKKTSSKADTKPRKTSLPLSSVTSIPIPKTEENSNLSKSAEEDEFMRELQKDQEFLAALQKEAKIRSGMDNSAFQAALVDAPSLDLSSKADGETLDLNNKSKKTSGILSKPRMNIFSKQFSFGKSKTPKSFVNKPTPSSYDQLIEDSNSLVSDDDDGDVDHVSEGTSHVRLEGKSFPH